MNIIPQVKEVKLFKGECYANKINWSFADGTDERVINAAFRICEPSDGVLVSVSHKNENSEDYELTIKETEISITANSAAGAFYALSTLKMLIKSNNSIIKCCHIIDRPDMPYRGFYQDTTRGRIPTLDTLKKLVDTMADYKMNSLQLYVEHSYEFKEYEHCCEELGYLTKAEIQELDSYCNEHFIELIPSLSTFGHLYHLLQSDKYKHLCELKDYKPTQHYWKERMFHHTINPLLDESFELITSLIDQHMEAFTSNKFNICCDETFDLGKDVNSDKDKGELYIGFVKKLVSYLESKGKTVMMWNDIVIEHSDKIKDLSNNIIFGSWDYDINPNEERVAPLKDRTQIVCPGTSAWEGFHERVHKEDGNILKMVEYGKKYGAIGVLNTNWGDLGNFASIDMAMYGLILGAAAAWNNNTKADSEFKQFVSEYHYGSSNAMNILEELSLASSHANWLAYSYDWYKYDDDSETAFKNSLTRCESIIQKIKESDFKYEDIKREFLIAAQGDSLMTDWAAHKMGYTVKSSVDFTSWLRSYEANWLEDSKRSELDEVIKIFTALHNGEIY